jgi:uncharacterized protein with FMN-binding domain
VGPKEPDVTRRTHQETRAPWGRAALVAALGATTALGTISPSAPVAASAAPGQPVVDDYGQSLVAINAEIGAAVSANLSVARAKAAVASWRATATARALAEARARTAYRAAVRSRSRSRIRTTYRAYVAAHAATVRARASYAAAVKAQAATVAKVTAAVKATHYLPVDGTYLGDLRSYLVPTVPFSFEPMQVQITVYAGHVSDVVVTAQADATSDSHAYNDMSLSTLTLEAMNAHDTATITAVTGASLTSEAFTQSLQSALVRAGFKA